MKKTKKTVESFELDHTKITAPFVRQCCALKGKKGDIVEKYDLRFTQPNAEEMDSAAIHTLEHLLATWLRANTKLNIIDISPMGCKTGFYMTIWTSGKTRKAMEDLISKALNKFTAWALTLKKEDVPAVNAVQCGNYKLHSLVLAKSQLKHIIKKDSFKPLEI